MSTQIRKEHLSMSEEMRQCTQCERWLALTLENFHKGKSRSGFKSKCKRCCKENAQAYREEHREKIRVKQQIYRDAHRKEKRPKVIIIDGKRQCTQCQRWLPHTHEYFHYAPHDFGGLKAKCRQCVSDNQTSEETKFRREMKQKGLKRCIRCKKWKPMTREYFHLDRGKFISHCKPCAKERRKEKSLTPLQILKARARRKRWEETHPEKHKEVVRQSRARHREQRLSSTRNYRALKRAAKGNHTPQDIHLLYLRQKRKCYYCKRHVLPPGIGERRGQRRSYQVDHIVPLSRGGSNDIHNLAISCAACNESKGNKLLHEWARGGMLL